MAKPLLHYVYVIYKRKFMVIEIQSIIEILERNQAPHSIQSQLQTITVRLRQLSSSQEKQMTLQLEKKALEIVRTFLTSQWIKTQPPSSDYLSLLI